LEYKSNQLQINSQNSKQVPIFYINLMMVFQGYYQRNKKNGLQKLSQKNEVWRLAELILSVMETLLH